MRELKFKAWDKVDKVMRSWKNVIFTKDKGDDFYLVGYEENKVITSFDHSQTLMQYTGLKDKNGVEIYEGDIVKVTDDDDNIDLVNCGIGTITGMSDLFMWYIDGEVHNGLYDISQSYYIEVIGNIYENPELLEIKNLASATNTN